MHLVFGQCVWTEACTCNQFRNNYIDTTNDFVIARVNVTDECLLWVAEIQI